MADLETGMSEDLASILDNDKMMEGQNNQRMRGKTIFLSF